MEQIVMKLLASKGMNYLAVLEVRNTNSRGASPAAFLPEHLGETPCPSLYQLLGAASSSWAGSPSSVTKAHRSNLCFC